MVPHRRELRSDWSTVNGNVVEVCDPVMSDPNGKWMIDSGEARELLNMSLGVVREFGTGQWYCYVELPLLRKYLRIVREDCISFPLPPTYPNLHVPTTE